MTIYFNQLVNRYLDAKEYVINRGYSWEIDWQCNQCYENITETVFLRETAWVILSSGFKESIIRRKFPMISNAFKDWESSSAICSSINICKIKALNYFKNVKKINAICEVIQFVENEGFGQVKKEIESNGIDYLKRLPYIGPITGLHLLKNLGFQFIKPDRHLTRIAKSAGFNNPQEMGVAIKNAMGDSLAEIDIVLWRYSTIKNDYIKHFTFGKKRGQSLN
ncbi:MAG: hypothetical protein SVY10_13755 [Thermodesulfobacteriota bacterium]|nr:hypothetical protein [Thermodesulfobacteriota bacterium]